MTGVQFLNEKHWKINEEQNYKTRHALKWNIYKEWTTKMY